MGYYDNDENFYEPSLVDEILSEYQEKMRTVLLDNVKFDIDRIKKENEVLREENKQYKIRDREILNKERDLKYKEDNLKREVEKEFYDSNIGETLKRYIDDCELWFADLGHIEKEKCKLCNDERELIAVFPNGKETKIKCECAKLIGKCSPKLAIEHIIKFSKKNSRHNSERTFYLSNSYSPSKDSEHYYSNNEFKIIHIINEFNDETINIHKNLSYSDKIAFRKIEECQKYCDWLNDKENK